MEKGIGQISCMTFARQSFVSYRTKASSETESNERLKAKSVRVCIKYPIFDRGRRLFETIRDFKDVNKGDSSVAQKRPGA